MTPGVLLEGALQPLDMPRAAFPDAASGPWQQTLRSILNAANARAADPAAELILGPPIYGRWYAGRHEVGTLPTRTWLDDLNLDPRERVVAALGTRVVQEQQEELMAEAWEQAGELAQANQRLRQMQLSLAITGRWHAHHVMRIEDDDTLWRLAAPAQARLLMPAAGPGQAQLTMRAVLATSSTPRVVTSSAMRRLSSPRGAISRRATTAVRLAGGQAPATPATTGPAPVGAMFRLYGAQPQLMTLHPAPDAGAGQLRRRDPAPAGPARRDRLLPGHPRQRGGDAQAPALRHRGRAGDADRHVPGRNAPPRAGAPVGQAERARRRPGDEPPDLPEPPEPEPEPPRPRPEPQPLVDSADAQAFRAAARRHLERLQPPPPSGSGSLTLRPLLRAAEARAQVRALLDPAPALRLRMAATIRLAPPDAPQESAPPEIGPLGGTPVYAQPMSEPLAALSQDWLLPGLERVPPDSVALLQPNQRFIEAFMLGLNVELGRELLWRDFVVRDPRATYFRRFWRAANPQAEGKGTWPPSPIGPTGPWGVTSLRAPRGAARSRWCCWCAAPCSGAIRAPSSTPCPRSRWGTGAALAPRRARCSPSSGAPCSRT